MGGGAFWNKTKGSKKMKRFISLTTLKYTSSEFQKCNKQNYIKLKNGNLYTIGK